MLTEVGRVEHNADMSLLQVVERWDGDKARITAIPIPDGASYTEQQLPNQHVPHWGSSDLVFLVTALADDGFHATDATVADVFAPSAEEDEEAQEFTEQLLEAVNSGPSSAEQFLADDSSDFLILAVTIASREYGSFRLAQNGQVRVLGQAASEHVTDFTQLLGKVLLAEE